MKNIFDDISKSFDVEIKNGDTLVNISERLLSVGSNLLSSKYRKRVEVTVSESSEETSDERFIINVGDKFDLNRLEKFGYERVNRVWGDREFSIIGDLIIFQRVGEEFAVRVSLFDSIIEEISLVSKEERSLIKKIQRYRLSDDRKVLARYCSGYDYDQYLDLNYFRNKTSSPGVDLGIREFPSERYSILEKIVNSYISLGFKVFVSTSNYELELKGCSRISEVLETGFVLAKSKVALLTDFEISGKVELFKSAGRLKSDKLFNEIVRGDYVVHQDHGIGIYNDLVTQDGIKYFDIHYAGKDRLLVPLSASNKLSRYVSSGGVKPRLTGLNSIVWGKIKSTAVENVKEIAKELVGIYAIRKISKAPVLFKGIGDKEELRRFVESFKYQDTEDQSVITEELEMDLSKGIPMDRLIVGDVGFGKTELAARAMFLAVNSGYQVAMLAPTTILTSQHRVVLSDRFKEYPFRIEVLNRNISVSNREKILREVQEGKVDILIGTHAILSDSVKFKNLGLLVIDEEQKFGVLQKEKLKKKKLDVHTLSITATPIPRTLNMAISGIRDLSILSSVPAGRKSIENYFGTFDWDLALKAIDLEVKRGGQVYFMHNRVADLVEIREEIIVRRPTLRVAISHGKMPVKKIEDVMLRFSNGEIDVLICSSIIENGLDIPNVNTIIVDDAQRYGLSSLYQIRGRVGRSLRQAYAYFFHNTLKGEAVERIDALSQANNIGSGFILSNRDLEIRGAGNILGKSQTGAINAVGYAMYTQLLEEAVEKLSDR